MTGAWLITNTPETDRVDVASPSMLPNSRHMSYGGDAYTGIQNAAADTERAVVDGVNELAALTIDLHEITVDSERDLTNHLVQGVGVLVISLGVVNFNLALRPAIRARRVR